MKLENVIYCGDNLIWLEKFPSKCIDLIYLDPPFFSNRIHEVIWNDGAEIRSFEDRWKGGIEHYIGWMKDRVTELKRVLKDTGSLYLHCDYHASHYLKVMCDETFGNRNFRNEIIWQKTLSRKSQSKQFGNMHDTIFLYSKTDNYIFNTQYENRDKETTQKRFPLLNDKGERFVLDNFTGAGQGLVKKFGDKLIEPPKGKHWIWGQDRIDEGMEKGIIKFTKNGMPRLVRYETEGLFMGDIWTGKDLIIHSQSKERLGYPTQKPEALLKRIIFASTNKGDLILDPFCGCGTTITVAEQYARKWIGIDVSPSACRLIKDRVIKYMVGKQYPAIIESPITLSYLKSLTPTEFQNRVIHALGGSANIKKTGDMGIDGFTLMKKNPIQVKQSEHIGRNVVDNFETAIERVGKDAGIIVAFSFTTGAWNEIARAKKKGIYIDLLEVDKLLEYNEVKESDKMFEFF